MELNAAKRLESSYLSSFSDGSAGTETHSLIKWLLSNWWSADWIVCSHTAHTRFCLYDNTRRARTCSVAHFKFCLINCKKTNCGKKTSDNWFFFTDRFRIYHSNFRQSIQLHVLNDVAIHTPMSVPTTLSFWQQTGTIRPGNSYFCITDNTDTLSFKKCNGDLNQKWV